MKHLWTPWRYKYLSSAQEKSDCIFCLAHQCIEKKECYVLYKSTHNLVLLNLFPYTNGHLMIAPLQHIATPLEATQEQLNEMTFLMKQSILFMKEIYSPGGFNVGMNIGKCAGAGFSDHFHLHILPRWHGDTNFMATLSETRLIPEELDITYEKLLPKYNTLIENKHN
ncbi:MAG: hypothetical protein A2Y62_13030 [Candidatus Fischerbacteria bacterium RBG_13_37_8]|uniref:HIT domain-containing protein n=1 Tax=Candidatus Fischerbacteria bacterium RBG_13_37_8 TaxID=1817863 RepID=A0A1F5V5Z6_9BACT|nr:MAG: hypothetical protein A2Y62_13030 [Candidatus Fischerbacteria bacterium RBG_13_37_8]